MSHRPWHRFLPPAYFLLPTLGSTAVTQRALPGVSEVRMVIYDVLGREVATLVNTRQAPGTYEVRFDGSRLASGVYFYRFTAGWYSATKAMLLER